MVYYVYLLDLDVIILAKTISATPTLVGQEAISFLKTMKKNNNSLPSKKQQELVDLVIKNKTLFC
jgi:hypothetical protein